MVAVSFVWVLVSVVVGCVVALLVVKNVLISLVSVDVLLLLFFAMVQWLLSVWRFECIAVVSMRLLSFSLDCVASLCVSWVARVNGGVASGLGGALVLFVGFGSNIVPFLTPIARRAEGVWGMRC